MLTQLDAGGHTGSLGKECVGWGDAEGARSTYFYFAKD